MGRKAVVGASLALFLAVQASGSQAQTVPDPYQTAAKPIQDTTNLVQSILSPTPTSPNTAYVPTSIASDCSRPVDQEITDFIASVPDNSVIEFPAKKCYSLADSVKVSRRSGLVIDGKGSKFKKLDVTPKGELHPNFLLVDNQLLTFRGAEIEGTFFLAPPRSPGRVAQMGGGNQFDMGLASYGGRELTFTDLNIHNTFGDGMYIGATGISPFGCGYWHCGQVPTNVRVENVTIKTAARMNIAVNAVAGLTVTRSTLADCWYWCIDIESDQLDAPVWKVSITKTTFDGAYFGFFTLPTQGTPGAKDNIEIRENNSVTFPDASGCGAAVLIGYWSNTGMTVTTVTVADNNFHAAAYGVVFRDVASGSVTNNNLTRAQDRCGPAAGLDRPVRLINSMAAVTGNTATGWINTDT